MGTQAHPAPSEKAVPCIARQPILTADESVIAYELLVRDDAEETRSKTDTDEATRATIDALNLIGLGVLCDGRAAFIPCTHAMLLMGYFSLLPPAEVVIELQDKVPDDEQVRGACEALKQSGYRVALDNFAPNDRRSGLAQYADYLKIDIRQYPSDQTATLVTRYGSKSCCMLATKVENRQNFVDAKRSGFTLYQGYFFRHPERLRARQIPGNQAIYLQLLQEVAKPALDFNAIEELIKRELSLCYRLLRYLNSPLLALASPVNSVRHALTLLGERETVRWIRMATTLLMGQEKSSDLVLSCLVRARFCELLGPKIPHGKSDLFLMGMLSLMDAILELPIGVLIEELCLDPELKAQLLSRKFGSKTPLSPIYDLMIAREAGNWETVTSIGKQLNLSLVFISQSYNEAMRWAHQITSAGRTQAGAKG
jgi:EAL and modified HD-GYP domain-containing signal transduction protein